MYVSVKIFKIEIFKKIAGLISSFISQCSNLVIICMEHYYNSKTENKQKLLHYKLYNNITIINYTHCHGNNAYIKSLCSNEYMKNSTIYNNYIKNETRTTFLLYNT